MVTLYTWKPKSDAPGGPHVTMMPDFGHSSLQIGEVYASFWPEETSLIGRVVSLLRPRKERLPRPHE